MVSKHKGAMPRMLSIAAVTAVLKTRLENELVNHSFIANIGSDVIVSVLPPDRIATGSDE